MNGKRGYDQFMSDTARDDEPGRSSPRENGFLAFWKTLPGILTGVAAVLTAIGGLAAVWINFSGPPEQEPPATTTDAVRTPQATPTSAPSASAGPNDAGVLHEDRIEMVDTDYVDLEAGKIGRPSAITDLYLHGTDQILAYYGMTPVSGPMTKSACAAVLAKRNNGGARISQVAASQWLCVQTKAGHLGGMRIAQRPAPGRPSVVFEYVIWN